MMKAFSLANTPTERRDDDNLYTNPLSCGRLENIVPKYLKVFSSVQTTIQPEVAQRCRTF